LKRRDFIKKLAAVCTSPAAMFWPFAARAQNPPAPTQNAPAPAPAADQATSEVGQVATLQGNATVTRGNPGKVAALRVNDSIFEHDTLVTGPDAALGITFDDQTTFSLSANTRIVVDAFVYQKGGTGNAATFNVAVGTAAFVASLVAKTGDMKITTPAATLGIRGTTGVVEVPTGGTGAGAAEPKIKLYADANGHVGQIEVFNRQGGRLGALTQSASAFTLTREPGGGVRAVPFQIPPGEAARDRGVLQQLRAAHTIGRRMTIERLRTRGPNRQGPNQRTPGHQQQPLNRNQRQDLRQGGAPHDGASPHQGGTPHPGGTAHPGGPSPQDRTLHPGGTPHQAGPPNPRGTPRQGGQPRQNMPRAGGPPRGGGGGGGGRNKRH
jgi:FecR protein